MSNYILCASPRSGSTLLCDLLWQTQIAGKPNSFFRAKSVADWSDFWGLAICSLTEIDQVYLDAAIAQGTQETNHFGMRIMWDNMPETLTQLRRLSGGTSDMDTLARSFGPCKFIHLSRDDKIAEAVSLSLAEQTGLWHRNADGTDRENFGLSDDPQYDAEQITRELRSLLAEEAGWQAWFTTNEIIPHCIAYETLANNPISALTDVLSFLGHDPAIADPLSPGTQKLATQLNVEWAARYRAEHGLPSAPAGA